jgi:hypothetical protein
MHAYREKFAGGSISRKHQSIRDRSPDGSICVVVRTLLTARPARPRNRLASCGRPRYGRRMWAVDDHGIAVLPSRLDLSLRFAHRRADVELNRRWRPSWTTIHPTRKRFLLLLVYLCSFFLRENTISAVNFSVPGFDLSGNRDSGRTRTTKYEASPTGQ